jgi:hypothetical protein
VPASVNVSYTGVRETLSALKKLDPELRRQTVREIKKPARPILADAKARVPESPMSGWRSGERVRFPTWNTPAKGLRLAFGGRAKVKRSQWPLLSLKNTDPGGALFDLAGKRGGNGSPQSQQFLRNVARFGRPSRVVWPAVEGRQAEVAAAVRVALDKAEAIINRQTR